MKKNNTRRFSFIDLSKKRENDIFVWKNTRTTTVKGKRKIQHKYADIKSCTEQNIGKKSHLI